MPGPAHYAMSVGCVTKLANVQQNDKICSIEVRLRHTEADGIVVCDYCTSQTMISASICQVHHIFDSVLQYLGG